MTIFTTDGFVLPADLLRKKLEHGANPNALYQPCRSDQLLSKAALLEAARDPELIDELAVLLSDPRLDKWTADYEGRTALHIACLFDNIGAIKLLLDAGFPTNARDTYLHTPLHYACRKLSYQAVLGLLSDGAEVNAMNSLGRTPLRECLMVQTTGVLTSLQEDIVRILLAMRAEPNLPDDRGMTALHVAASAGYSGIVRILLVKNADSWARNKLGQRPIDLVNDRLAMPITATQRRNLELTCAVLLDFERMKLQRMVPLGPRSEQLRPLM